MKRSEFIHIRLAATPVTASYPNAVEDAIAFAEGVHKRVPFEGEPRTPKKPAPKKKGRRA